MILVENKHGYLISSFDYFDQQYRTEANLLPYSYLTNSIENFRLNKAHFLRQGASLRDAISNTKKRKNDRPLNHNEKYSKIYFYFSVGLLIIFVVGRASLDFHSSCFPFIDIAYQSMRSAPPIPLSIAPHHVGQPSTSTILRMSIRNRLLENATEREIEFEESKYILPRACKFLMV